MTKYNKHDVVILKNTLDTGSIVNVDGMRAIILKTDDVYEFMQILTGRPIEEGDMQYYAYVFDANISLHIGDKHIERKIGQAD